MITTAPSTPESLPPHFTLELTPAGQLFADGTPVVDDEELLRRARVAAQEVSEAALFGDPGAQGPRLAALFDALLKAGFVHVRFAARASVHAPASVAAPAVPGAAAPSATAPRPLAPPAPPIMLPPPVAVAPPAAPAPAPAATVPVAPSAAPAPPVAAPLIAPAAPAVAAPAPVAPSVEAPPLPPPVVVKERASVTPASGTRTPASSAGAFSVQTAGLRIIGGADDDASRQRMVQLFERSFPSFRRCYPLAQNRDANSSVGVDLSVPKSGGTAKIREMRTRLEGAAFRQCMERAFTAIRFAPPRKGGAAYAISYSVLFKPGES